VSLTLQDVCAEIARAARGNPAVKLPGQAAISKTAAALEGFGAGREEMKAGKNYDLIATRIKAKIDAGQELDSKELRDAAWCLWRTKPALADSTAGLMTVLRGSEQSDRRRPFRALASSYVSSYASTRAGLDAVSRSLARQASRWGNPWRKLQEELRVFDGSEGPAQIARAALKANLPVVELLKAYGLGVVNAQTGIAKAASDEILLAIAAESGGDHEDRLKRVQRFALRPDNGLQFADQARLVAMALLKPFQGRKPGKLICDRYLRVVVSLFGDPRLHPGRWNSMRDLEEMVRRWLTEQSLRQFLDVVDRVAEERMWKYRRAFWEAVYDAQLISEAWVVFADLGAQMARGRFGPEASFGRFDYGGRKHVQSGHAVLLLRIGRGIVADWSHDGKCDIWADAEDKSAPRMYQPTYDSDEIRIGQSGGNLDTKDRFSVSHMSPETYSWQLRVADRLYDMTGARIPQFTYTVR
jgi:hypothetical protein